MIFEALCAYAIYKGVKKVGGWNQARVEKKQEKKQERRALKEDARIHKIKLQQDKEKAARRKVREAKKARHQFLNHTLTGLILGSVLKSRPPRAVKDKYKEQPYREPRWHADDEYNG